MDGGGRELRPIAKKTGRRNLRAPGIPAEEALPLSRGKIFLRRFFHKAEARVETLPPLFGTMSALAFISSFALYGLFLNGELNRISNKVTASLGFEVQTVKITGHHNLTERDIIDAMALEPGLSLATFSVSEAHAMLLDNPWVESASVRKVYPGKVTIIVKERKPFAVWRRGRQGELVSIIDRSGKEIGAYDSSKHSALPVLYGYGAEEKGADFQRALAKFPTLQSRVRLSLYRSQRRWDLLLNNNVTVKLPEKGFEQSLQLLADLDQRSAILSKDIESIDMRLADRLVMRLSDEAMINRLATLKKRKETRSGENET